MQIEEGPFSWQKHLWFVQGGAFKYVKTYYYHPFFFLYFSPMILQTPLGIIMNMEQAFS